MSTNKQHTLSKTNLFEKDSEGRLASVVAHLPVADSIQDLLDAHATVNYLTPKSKKAPLLSVMVAVLHAYDRAPLGTAFPKNHWQFPASWQGPPATTQDPIFRILYQQPPDTILRAQMVTDG